MNASDLPQGTADPLSFDDAAAELADILSDDPETDPVADDRENDAFDEDAGDETDSAAAEDAQDRDDDTPPEAGEAEDMVEMPDGTQVPLADLMRDYGQVQKREADMQRDYTRKTEELAHNRREVEKQGSRLLQWAEETRRERDALLAYQQQFMVAEPDPALISENIVAYQEQKALYEQQQRALAEMQQAAAYSQQQEATQYHHDRQRYLDAEKAKVVAQFPELNDPRKRAEFEADLASGLQEYGFAPNAYKAIDDARYVSILKDAMAYRKLKARAPRARAAMDGKPKLIRSGRRPSAQGRNASRRKAKADRLAKTGSLAAGIDALMDMDL